MAAKDSDPASQRDLRAVERDVGKHDALLSDIQQKLSDLSTGQSQVLDTQSLAQDLAKTILAAQKDSITAFSQSVTQLVPEQQTVKMPQLDVTKMTKLSQLAQNVA